VREKNIACLKGGGQQNTNNEKWQEGKNDGQAPTNGTDIKKTALDKRENSFSGSPSLTSPRISLKKEARPGGAGVLNEQVIKTAAFCT